MTTLVSAPPLRRAILIGLVGEGVAPSLTPHMHELEGARHGMHYVYRAIDLAEGTGSADVAGEILRAAARLGFDGLNITHPIKQAVVPLLDELSPSARAVGAVNTVVFAGDRTIGHNTDVSGFGAGLDDSLGDAPRRRVVLVGAGGAGAAVAVALAGRGVDDLVIADMDQGRARDLASKVGSILASEEHAAHATARSARVRAIPLTALADTLAQADGVVNATPFGMAAHPGTAFDPELLRPDLWVADIVYRPVETALLGYARERGCRVMSGLGMAMNQAADAFEIFTGEAADRAAMLSDLTDMVAAEEAGTFAPEAPKRGREQ